MWKRIRKVAPMKHIQKNHKRKNIRIKGYDYSKEGYYFITICTQHKKCILSTINVGVAPQGDPQTKKIILSTEGKIIDKYINNYNKKFNNIKIDEYVIMPNHVHFIIALKCCKGSPKGATPTIPHIINSFKSIITKEIGYSIWQRNYYEHIIRNEKEYLIIKEYIINNPIKWKKDKYY